MKKIKKILAIVISIILFCVLMLTILLTTTKNLITKNNLSTYIKDGNILNVKANFFLDIDDDITLSEKIEQMALSSGIPKDITDDILASNELNDLLGEFFSESINYVLKNTTKPNLSDETIEKMINLTLESYEKHINVVIEKDTLIEYVENYTKALEDMIPERIQIMGDTNFIVNLQEFVKFNHLYLYLIMAFLVVLIALLTWSLYKPIKYLAIPMIISGAIFVVFGSADGIINDLLTSRLLGMESIISPLITNILTLWFKCGVIFSFTGVFLLVIYAAIVRMLKHN